MEHVSVHEIKERIIKEKYIECPSCGSEINDVEHEVVLEDGRTVLCYSCGEEIEIGDNPY